MFACCKEIHENVAILNKGTEDELRCEGYQRSQWRRVVYIILCLISLGIVWILCRWMTRWKVHLTSYRCSLKKADIVLLEDAAGNLYVEEVHCEAIGSPRGFRDYSTFKQRGTNAPTEGPDDYFGEGHVFKEVRKKSKETPIIDGEQRCMVRYIEHHHLRYGWNEASFSFEILCGLEKDTTCKDIVEKYTGFNSASRVNRLTLYGMNRLVIDVRSYVKLLFQEVLNPFYVFQIVSIAIWFWEFYYIYAVCIFVISVISLSVELYETRKQQVSLRNTVMTDDIMINVFVPGSQDTIEVTSSMLVPGDLIHIPCHVFTMPCDVALVSGSVVVDEGMLTGESIPITKTHLSEENYSDIYSPIGHKKHTLFCGTKVLQTRFYGNVKVKAVVVRTGYSTMKGELVRMILYPKPIKFSFYSDALKFVFFLALVATVGFLYTFTFLTVNKFNLLTLIPKALDVITIAVPPALPAAMTVGIIYAQSRLKKQQIFCISPQRINLCGKLNCMCFDKTGTLTEDGLDLWGVVTVAKNEVIFNEPIREPKTMPTDDPFVVAMATCHSLTYIDGETCGDPLDLKMFESINWLLEEPATGSQMYDSIAPVIVKPITMETYMPNNLYEHSSLEVAILKQFTFDSALQRMSVVVRMTSSNHMIVFAKGSPEKIISISDPSTVPENFNEIFRRYTSKGYRVIAMATKNLEKSVSWHHVQRLSRDSVENNLKFLGLLVMENKLKPETTPVLRHLNEAEIKTVMITGDNILTALCVAKQCNIVKPGTRIIQVEALPPENGKRARINWLGDEGHVMTTDDVYQVEPMIEVDSPYKVNKDFEVISLDDTNSRDDYNYQLAITGRSYSVICQYFPELLQKVVAKAAIFARMTPDQKSSVIENLQSLGLTVGMCGDGANDCGALRASHAGISLSQMEASVASPFTSKVDNISCVPMIIKEGRGSLVTSFGVFKFMALYSIIQFASVIILTSRFSKLSDPMFLYIDLFTITVLALTMGRTEPSTVLSRDKPRSRLASPSNLMGISVHVIMVIAIQLAAFFYVTAQPWYIQKQDKSLDISTMEMTCVFNISMFQYLVMAFAFSKGMPFRKRLWTNGWLTSSLVILTITSVVIVISPWKLSKYLFDIEELPSTIFKISLLFISFGNFLLTTLFEEIIFESLVYHKICQKIFCRRSNPLAYKMIIDELQQIPDWPPVGHVTWSTVMATQTKIRMPSS